MTNPQAVTPTDEKLERLIEELSQAVGIAEWADPLCTFPCCESRRENATAARAALREYVSATVVEARKTGRSEGYAQAARDAIQTGYANPFPLVTEMERELDATGDTHSETSLARRASMKEPE